MSENDGLRKHFTQQEVMRLGRELREAKVEVLLRWGFTTKEIANILEVDESVATRIIDKVTNKQKDKA